MSNPLLDSIKLPGRIFQLPSKGVFYKNGELDPTIKNGEIHVMAMSALDEINMKNPDQLFSGAAIKDVFKQCIEGINSPTELLSKDVDAIMIFLRLVTYGPEYSFTATHTCENAKDHSYSADIDLLSSQMEYIDETTVEQLYTVELSNGQVVKLKPSRYKQVIDQVKANQGKETLTVKDQQDNLMRLLLGVIESVDGITDTKLINEWAVRIPSTHINKIGSKIEGLNKWGAKTNWTCRCLDCGEDFLVEIPINPVSFFTE